MKLRHLSALSLSLLVPVLASCGSSSTGSSTPSEPAIQIGSPALTTGKLIPARYKCDVRNVWLPLRWGALPANTQELVLYTVRFGKPKVGKSGTVQAEIKAASVVVGIKPVLHELALGKFPHGAIVGVHEPNNPAASICPPKGDRQNLLFRLFALPHKLDLGKGTQSPNLVNQLSSEALDVGTFTAEYRSS